ncbi:MAG TPA: response regulator [Lacunisphaera sp.]|nr:response regulator [Lacunisphaera sp.]
MTRILIADDDESIRLLLRRMLQRLGYETVEAENGKEAMDRYEEAKPECVITDLIMPGQEGIETIMQMRRHSHRAAIIAMSGDTGTRAATYLKMSRALGADVVLQKPFSVEQLTAAVEKLVGKAQGAKS